MANWISKAIKHPGALHRELGVPEGKKIPAGKLAAAAKKGGKEGARARLAQTLSRFQHSPDRYNERALGERPPRTEYHTAQDQASGDYPKAPGPPSAVEKSDGRANMRADGTTKQSGHQSTPGNRDSRPSKVDSYNDSEV